MIVLVGLSFLGSGVPARQATAELREVDDARARAAGIRKLAGRHLVLYTDVASSAEVDRLPAVFDRAVPLWAARFGIDPRETADWQVRGYLIADRRPFDALGMMPTDRAEFANGLTIGSELWLHEQPTDYYRRHLLLHEGTHAFMWRFLGGCGPGWYMEGMAELLATHSEGARGQGPGASVSRLAPRASQLTLNIMPRDRREVPMLGRIKLVRDAFAADRALVLAAVMELDSGRQLGNEAYAWCWAAAKFLDSHPRYRVRFRSLQRQVRDEQFNEVVRREFRDDWRQLVAEWRSFVATLDHGYDFERMAIEFRRGEPLGGRQRRVKIAADRGWQSSGVWLEAGQTYRLRASGRYQIAVESTDARPAPWMSEAGGVTIEYHDGRPLGMLLGAIDGEGGRGKAEGGSEDQVAVSGFAKPMAIGLSATISPQVSGTLYLRVNDSAGRLGDNRGTLTISIDD